MNAKRTLLDFGSTNVNCKKIERAVLVEICSAVNDTAEISELQKKVVEMAVFFAAQNPQPLAALQIATFINSCR